MPDFSIIHTLTDTEENPLWPHKTGFIDIDMIREYRADYSESLFYIAGPPGFNKAMAGMLDKERDISQESVITENFTGY